MRRAALALAAIMVSVSAVAYIQPIPYFKNWDATNGLFYFNDLMRSINSRFFNISYNTFNLLDYGAKCDARTDDTIAIQNWLNVVAANTTLTAPAGICLFSSALTAKVASNITITGTGAGTTMFLYTGATTTSNMLTITGAAPAAILLSNFAIESETVMTGGSALKLNNVGRMVLSNVWVDNENNLAAWTGNLCGGVEIADAGDIFLLNLHAYSLKNCGDGVKVWGASAVAEFQLSGGQIGGTKTTGNVVTGFANGIHMAGGVGGVRCDNTNIHNNQIDWLVDEASAAVNNRDFSIGSTCALDSGQTAGLLVNDSNDSDIMNVAGWVASTQQGPGIYIEAAGPDSSLQLGGDVIYNNCGDGVLLASANIHVYFSAATPLKNNGENLGAGCATWQAGAGSGTGYGLHATVAPASAVGLPSFIGNVAGLLSGSFVGLTLNLGSHFTAAGHAISACGPTLSGFTGEVDDATNPTYNATYSSGGTVPALVLCDGSNWKTR